jgi:DNA-binding winged helix-turn-helix (wHTH) protein
MESVCFDSFSVDPVNARLQRNGKTILLTPKAFSVLQYLVLHPQRLVTKKELLEVVWAKRYVGEAVIKVCVREIRKAIGDEAKAPHFIETVHTRGYRFIGEIARDGLAPCHPRPSNPLPEASCGSKGPLWRLAFNGDMSGFVADGSEQLPSKSRFSLFPQSLTDSHPPGPPGGIDPGQQGRG